MAASTHDLFAHHVELRLAAQRRHRAFLDRGAATAHVEAYLRPIHEEGTIHALGHDAIVGWRRQEDSFYGVPVWNVALDFQPGAPVEPWLREVLPAGLGTMRDEIDLLLERAYAPARGVLFELGLGVDSVQLLGDVARASEALGPAPWPKEIGLRPMTHDDVDAVIELYRAIFSVQPEFCWFGASPRYLEDFRTQLVEWIEGPHPIQHIVSDGDAIGHIGASVSIDHALFGPSAGMGLCLAPALQRRGLARPIYRHLLDAMADAGVRTFKGGTSQPSVMRLGREMGRELQGWCLRRDVPFEPPWFDRYYPAPV